VRDGGVIAYPTDSSYALGCQLGNAQAAQRMRAIRGLGDNHLLTLVCRDLADAGRFVRLSNWQFRIVRQGVPGPFTFVLPATREVPRRILNRKGNTVGVRVPDHVVVSALLSELQEPILSTTLILPGDAMPLNDPSEIRERLETTIDAVIDAGPCPTIPTTVVDLSHETATVMREGAGNPARLGLTSGKMEP